MTDQLMHRTAAGSAPDTKTSVSQASGRRFGVGLKLGLVMALFLLMWGGHFSIGYFGNVDIQRFANRIDDTGRLRMLSQRIAYLVSQAGEPQDLNRRALRDAIVAYEDTLARLDANTSTTLLQSDRKVLRKRTEQLTAAWLDYRSIAEEVQADNLSLPRLRMAQINIIGAAADMLGRAESLMALTIEAQVHAQERLDMFKNFLHLGGLALLLAIGAALHHRAIVPLRKMAALARLSARGDHTGRIDFDSNDELGDLARALNLGNAHTQQLIEHLESESAALRRAELRHRTLLESAADAIIITGTDGRIQQLNQQAERMFGYTRQELIGALIEQLMPASFRRAHVAKREHYVAQPTPRSMGSGLVIRALSKDGREIPVEISLSPSRIDDERLVVAVIRDITERKRAEAIQARLTAMLDATTDIIALLTPQRAISYLNPAGRRLLGLPESGPLTDRDWLDVLHARTKQEFLNEAWPLTMTEGVWSGEMTMRGADGQEIATSQVLLAQRDDAQELEYIACVGRDISERKRYENELQHRATHDQLTGLANRTLFEDRLGQAIHHAHRHQRLVGVLFVDLDNFKLVNDSLGHAVGDELLRVIARRMTAAVRPGDTVARHGGDEFAVVLDDLAQSEDAIRVVHGLIESISQPIELGGQSLIATTSIGISLYPRDAVNAADLMMNADAALYRAKAEGRNRYCFYTADMNREASLRLETENGLRRALERNELVLFYQPIVEAASGRIVGAEALLRWQHPQQGLLAPDHFIAVAEETGLILPIGEWVLGEACAQTRRWHDAGLSLARVAVNVSARQCRGDELIRAVERALAGSGLAPQCLELELTESSLMASPDRAKVLLDRVRALGVRLVIDDFGIGYSSLGQLKQFRFDKVKIDRSFVSGICTDSSDAVIAEAIIGMAHTLGATVVGEGVEEHSQREQLLRFGCDELQGYLFSRPLPAAEFETLLRRQASRAAQAPTFC